MSGDGQVDDVKQCEACGERPALARVKHRETTRHWRCAGCLRGLASSGPVIVTGWAVRGRIVALQDVPLVDEHRALQAMPKPLRPPPEIAPAEDNGPAADLTDLDRQQQRDLMKRALLCIPAHLAAKVGQGERDDVQCERLPQGSRADPPRSVLVARAPLAFGCFRFQERAAAIAYIEAFARNYPEDVFPPIDGDLMPSRDRVGAAMARHLCAVLAADLRRGLHVGEDGE